MPQEIENFRVTAAVLNVRAEPSTTSKILGHITRDQVIEKIAETPDGAWVQLQKNTLAGWSSKKYLSKLAEENIPIGDFAWLAVAEKEFGVSEFPGRAHNPRVVEYLSSVTNIGPRWRSQDETPWCSAFVNWCVEKAGYVGTKSALSTSWLDWGKKIEDPIKGCIAVFSREAGGHVGFYIDETNTLSESYIKILGGNQEHAETEIGAVSMRHYPKSKLLGYRIPK